MTSEVRKRLYREMLRIRLVEETIAEVYAQQEMRCPVHLCIGQEAIAVGVCAHLEQTDYAFGTHRAHGHYLAKGGALLGLFAELYGREAGCCRGRGGSMHLVDIPSGFLAAAPIVGSTIPIAVGAAFGAYLKRRPAVTVAFFGDGATEEGVFHEAINFAALRRLPVVFVCENNGYSVYSSLRVRRPEGMSLCRLAASYGIDSHQADGNDVTAVYDLAGAAVERAKTGAGPTFLEFATSRWREHCGPNYDDDLGYRTAAELSAIQQDCPIANFRARLISSGVLSEAAEEELSRELTAEIEAALRAAKESPYPEAGPFYEQVYA